MSLHDNIKTQTEFLIEAERAVTDVFNAESMHADKRNDNDEQAADELEFQTSLSLMSFNAEESKVKHQTTNLHSNATIRTDVSPSEEDVSASAQMFKAGNNETYTANVAYSLSTEELMKKNQNKSLNVNTTFVNDIPSLEEDKDEIEETVKGESIQATERSNNKQELNDGDDVQVATTDTALQSKEKSAVTVKFVHVSRPKVVVIGCEEEAKVETLGSSEDQEDESGTGQATVLNQSAESSATNQEEDDKLEAESDPNKLLNFMKRLQTGSDKAGAPVDGQNNDIVEKDTEKLDTWEKLVTAGPKERVTTKDGEHKIMGTMATMVTLMHGLKKWKKMTNDTTNLGLFEKYAGHMKVIQERLRQEKVETPMTLIIQIRQEVLPILGGIVKEYKSSLEAGHKLTRDATLKYEQLRAQLLDTDVFL